MRILKSSIWILVSVIILLGCSVEVEMHSNEKSETDMGSHHVIVKPHSTFTRSSSLSGGDSETYLFTCGEISVTIQNDKLIVNNVNYGTLKTGEAILIDNGKIFIADQERKGVPMTDKEIIESAPVKETTEELAGYNVTVRPGSSSISKIQILSKHTLIIGRTEVSIKKNELFVNEISYGLLKSGDTILVEHRKVSVSGKDREERI